MPKFDLVSFDLQGTLSDSRFSDEFWLDLLPELYARHHRISSERARQDLKTQFATMGKYDRRYYSCEYWLQLLCPDQSFKQVISQLQAAPLLFLDSLLLVEELQKEIPLIIVSTTTWDFINVELGSASRYFQHIYSTLDDLEIAGKPPQVFQKLAQEMGLNPERILHVGDCAEMDIKNAELAGWQSFYFDKKQPRERLLSELHKLVSI